MSVNYVWLLIGIAIGAYLLPMIIGFTKSKTKKA